MTKGKKANNLTYSSNNNIKANLNYSLTKTQDKASNEILSYVLKNQSVIVNAVCGAGKTELVYKSIEHYINKGLKVAFTIPRKDVCIEIYNRLKKDYPSIDISLVYGGHTKNLEGQLIVLTTHQLYRYENYFDLLILDEADAFPYYKDELLETFLNKSVKGPIIYLSATIKDDYLSKCSNVVLVNKRFHNHDLPVPTIIKYNKLNKIKVLNNVINSLKNKPILIFVPTIEIGMQLSKKINIPFVYSSFLEKEKFINDFKNKAINKLITTSILERGMTFFDVQVIVYESNHKLFDVSSLIQISGRVGRKINAPSGKVLFLCDKTSKEMNICIKEIIEKNKTVA